jgi:hypothetical protein
MISIIQDSLAKMKNGKPRQFMLQLRISYLTWW